MIHVVFPSTSETLQSSLSSGHWSDDPWPEGDSLMGIMDKLNDNIDTYDHRSVRTGHPVRSAIHKH